jgi:zinc protease
MALLTRRLQAIANAEESKLINGAAGLSPSRDLAWSSTVSASVKDGEWKAGLQTLEQELRRALKHGFTESELKVQLTDMEGGYKRAADQASTRDNRVLAASILSVIDDNDVITRPEDRLAFFREIRPTITIGEVNAEIRRLWAGSAPLVFVTDKKLVEPTEIAAAMQSSRQVAVAPQADKGDLKFAYDDFGPAGKVVSDSRIADLGIRTMRFANNVRLNIKTTDFEQGSVRFSVRVPGGELALPDDKPGLGAMASSVSMIAALEKHSLEDLKQILAGRSVHSGLGVGADAFAVSGGVAKADLPLQMRLSAAFLTAPGYRPEAASRWATLLPVIEGQRRSTAQAVASYELPQVIANGDPRFGLPETPVLAKRSLAELRSTLQPILADAPIEIGIVGDIDEQAAIDAVAQSFGALPKRRLEAPAYEEARKASFRKDLAPVTLTHSGPADQALLTISWPTDDDDDLREVAGLNLLASVVRLELTEALREQLGATYTATANSSMSNIYDEFGQFSTATLVAPEKLPDAEKAVAQVVARLRTEQIGKDLLARALNPMLERVDRQQRDNGYWISLVSEAQSEAERLDRHRKRKAIYQAVTPAELQRLAEKYLGPDRQLTVRIVSDKLPKTVANR